MTLADRFWRRVDVTTQPGGCWIWCGFISGMGYGLMWGRGKTVSAHRIAWEIAHGPIPAGMVIDHLCRCPECVNPMHMEPVTVRENTRRGAALSAANALKTECPQGHAYTPENTRTKRSRTTVQRVCRTCERDAAREYQRRRRAA